MKTISRLSCLLLLLAPATALRAGSELEFLYNPVLVYNCDITGDFKFTQVYYGEYDQCVPGYGLSKKFSLKAFSVQGSSQFDGGIPCNVHILYGECVGEDGKRYKYYWFESGGGEDDPDFCNIYSDCPDRIDSICDGVTIKKGEPSIPTQGKKFWRSIFFCFDSVNCPPLDREVPTEELVFDLLDLGGALTKCNLQVTLPLTKVPFKDLVFCYGTPEPGTRKAYICAPKDLCGTFFTYCLNRSGVTSPYPDPYLVEVAPDLSIECVSDEFTRSGEGDPGYHFASIAACLKCRLNTELTACANLLEPVCDTGNAGHGFLNMPESLGRNVNCELYPGSIEYGVLLVALYLENMGYEFDEDGAECVVHQALGLPLESE